MTPCVVTAATLQESVAQMTNTHWDEIRKSGVSYQITSQACKQLTLNVLSSNVTLTELLLFLYVTANIKQLMLDKKVIHIIDQINSGPGMRN